MSAWRILILVMIMQLALIRMEVITVLVILVMRVMDSTAQVSSILRICELLLCATLNISDINECQVKTDNCHSNALCTDSSGSFQCACQIGYYGDGVNCSSKSGNKTVCYVLA